MALRAFPTYPIGVAGTKWGDDERLQWRTLQEKKRDYTVDVIDAVQSAFSKSAALAAVAEIVPYGTLDYSNLGLPSYSMIAVKSKQFSPDLRTVLVTGGVHGYETSGVHGAIRFIAEQFANFSDKVNVLVLPCVSPWAYETINRWNPNAVDPNRSFNHDAPGCGEAGLAMTFVRETCKAGGRILTHIDLHETTDTDNSEFTPARFARDGIEPEPWTEIPDGFYLVADSDRPPQLEFQTTMIAAVSGVTHIAPSDEAGCIIGEPLVAPGVVSVPCGQAYLCASQTDAPYVTTTEVYPDSPKATPEICNQAQVECVVAGINYSLANVI